jgi:hypothetical protein
VGVLVPYRNENILKLPEPVVFEEWACIDHMSSHREGQEEFMLIRNVVVDGVCRDTNRLFERFSRLEKTEFLFPLVKWD